jgi:hypothetical protein
VDLRAGLDDVEKRKILEPIGTRTWYVRYDIIIYIYLLRTLTDRLILLLDLGCSWLTSCWTPSSTLKMEAIGFP